ncbi:MAG: tRNA pseudouridine(55) synthase TruB [Anaerolineae bacterium]|nr:tRNA pseudouridine(55) synthase TruB [Anaerolineae bacterium]
MSIEPFGFLVVDKPQGMTSHDVVAKTRRGTGIKRIGHVGTLDPLATGMLVLCVGAATRLSEYVMHTDKLYMATVRLGIETSTYDAEGEVISTADARHISKDQIDRALGRFRGAILQVPPMYSAIKQGGKKLYELAREGQVVERDPRPITIHAIHTYETQRPHDIPNVLDAKIVVWCSSGTYIRSIAHDLGETLGVGAHLVALHRRIIGGFQHMTPWGTMLAAFHDGSWRQFLWDETIALSSIPALHLSDEETQFVQQGRLIGENAAVDGTLRRAYTADGKFLAILAAREGHWHPHKVFSSAD